jgi:hypothetical protein
MGMVVVDVNGVGSGDEREGGGVVEVVMVDVMLMDVQHSSCDVLRVGCK